jgi:hypothetical protein
MEAISTHPSFPGYRGGILLCGSAPMENPGGQGLVRKFPEEKEAAALRYFLPF